MKKLLGFVGMFVGGAMGTWLAGVFGWGVFGGFMLGIVGTAVGLFAAIKLAQRMEG